MSAPIAVVATTPLTNAIKRQSKHQLFSPLSKNPIPVNTIY